MVLKGPVPHFIENIRFGIIFKEKEFLQKVKEFILSRGDLELKMAQIEKKSRKFWFRSNLKQFPM